MSPHSISSAFFSILFVALASIAATSAQTATPSPAPTPIPEIGHVVTSDRSDETLQNTVRTTYVVTAAEIARRGFASVADAIADLPGVNIFRYGSTGSLSGVGLRGSTSAQVLILFDGLPAAGQETGTLDLNSISTAGIDRIEVVEGGGSTLYGAGAVGGIINVITRTLHGNPAVKLADGSFGDRAFRVQTKNFTFERTVATNDYALGSGAVRTGADSESTDARFVATGGNATWQTKISGEVSAHHLGDPGSVPAEFTTPSRQNSVDRDLFASVTRHSTQAETTLELSAASQQFLFYCVNVADPNCFTPAPALTTDSRVQASLRNTVRALHNKFVYGIDLARGVARLDDGLGDITSDAYAQAAVYAEQNWLWERGDRAYVGLRGERDGAQGGIIAPSAGFLRRISPALTVRVNYATAFRAPSAEDLYFPGGFGNPRLQAERMRVMDVRLDDSAAFGTASLTWFASKTVNKIVPDENFVPQNIGHANIEGLTAEIRTAAARRYYARLSVTNLYRAVDAQTNLRISAAGPVFSVSTELGSVGAPSSAIDSWGLMTQTRGAQYYAFSQEPASGYLRVDGFMRVRFAKNALLSIRIYNITNHRISDVPGYPEPGRRFLIELATR